MEAELTVNPIYRPHLNNMARTQIFYGGSGSGKSVFLAQRAVLDILKGGRNYLICRAVGRTIRKSVLNEIKKVMIDSGLSAYFTINKTDGIITCTNGYQILFAGLDDTEKIKSITPEKGVITDIWIEEATEVEARDVKDLNKRLRGGDEKTDKRMTLSFNPVLRQHWIYTQYFSSIGWEDNQTEYVAPELSIQKTWFEHNKFLTKQDIEGLLNETDKYYSDVYTWGLWGVLGNVIFTNWRVEDLSGMRNQFVNRRNGLDFGFSSNPAAIGVSHYDKMRKTIYVYDEFYDTGYTNDLLAIEIKRMIGNDQIVCDSAEPKSIQELRNYGVNATGAKKGKDSINFGIQWLQQQTIIVDKNCINAQNELRQYKWKEGADGKPVSPPKPLDKDNHFIDGGLRYAYEDDMIEQETEYGPNPFGEYRG